MFPLSSGNYYDEYKVSESDKPSESRRSSESEESSEGEIVSEEIAILDNVLQPGLVKKYFNKNSLTELFSEIKKLIENKNVLRLDVKKPPLTAQLTGLNIDMES